MNTRRVFSLCFALSVATGQLFAVVPTAPSNLTATAVSSSEINLAWGDDSSNETGFNVQRSTDGINFALIATLGANVTTYSDTSLIASTTYYYRVRSVNGDGPSTSFSDKAAATTLAPPAGESPTPTPTPPLVAPSNLTAKAVSTSEINLAWTDNSSNETKFNLQRSTDGINFAVIASPGANVTTYSDKLLAASTRYYYRVRAVNADSASVFSNKASATTLAAPTPTPSPTPTPDPELSPTPTPSPTSTPSATPTPIATGPSVPRGVFSLVAAGNKINPTTLANPSVDGVSLRQFWADFEPMEGVFDFAYLDAEIERASRAGKQVLIRVPMGGDDMPAWVTAAVRNAGGSTFTFTDSNGQHTIPVFWDPTFLAKKNAVMAALGARYRNHPAVKVVTASFANARTADWNIPHGTQIDPRYGTSEVTRWQNAGYTTQKMLDAGKSVIDAAMEAFPNQVISLAINYSGTLDKPYHDNYVSEQVIANARAFWGTKRLVVGKNSLKATTMPPPPPPHLSLAVWYNSREASCGQTYWYAYGDTSYRMNDGVRCDPAWALKQAVDIGIAYGISYIELYQIDVLNLPEVISYAHSRLTAY